MAKEFSHTDKAPAAVGPDIQAAKTGGMVYCSGQLGLIPETGVLPEGVEAQAHQAMKNMGACLLYTSYQTGRVKDRTAEQRSGRRKSRC